MQLQQPIIIDTTSSSQRKHTLSTFIFSVTAAHDFCSALLVISLSQLNNKERKQGNKIARESLLCYSFSRVVRLLRFFIIPFPIEVYMRIYFASPSLCKQYLRAPFCPRWVAERKLHPDTDKQQNVSLKGPSTLNEIPLLNRICSKLCEFILTRAGYWGKDFGTYRFDRHLAYQFISFTILH